MMLQMYVYLDFESFLDHAGGGPLFLQGILGTVGKINVTLL